jgi:ABC-type phosphate/phosphonate transport system permease subunit
MSAPIYSTVTLVAEIFVSSAIFYSFYQGYKNNKFPEKLAIAALTYEILFNISYMAYRLPSHEDVPRATWRTILGAFHGTLSLIMFISLIAFFALAIKNYRKDTNYFKEHKRLTFTFLCFWTLSILTGMTFYFVEYYF